MIVVYAGRRARALGGDPDRARARIRRLLAAMDPSAVVGSAADGADLLVMEAALAVANGPQIHVVLPTRREVFAEDSVEAAWRERFEAVLDEVEDGRGTVSSLALEPGDEAYRAANKHFLDLARDLAADGEGVATVVVAREGEGQVVEHLCGRARLRGLPVVRIDPAVDLATRPRCFVAMPFGRKFDAQRGIEVNCNEVYEKVLVPALENAQLNYRRADEEIDSGIVLEPMIEWIAEAELVIGDLETGNFNVGWELGLRHLLRTGQTLLVGPAGTTAPFDLAALRHVPYRQDEKGITDADAVAGWQALGPYLSRAGEPPQNDSPVASTMEVERWGAVRRRTVRDERWDTLRARLALARDIGDAEQMLAVLDEAQGLPEEHGRLLRAEAGVGLVRLRRFQEARPLLREIVAADEQVQRPEAHVFYAQALYRADAAPPDDLAEAERVLQVVLATRPGHPEVRALLGAIAKRRFLLDGGPRRAELRAALEYYRHDVERNLNLYYEGINVVALGTVLALVFGDEDAGRMAAVLTPVVHLAAGLAAARPDERYWALASIAECTLHEHLRDGRPDATDVREAYRRAGAERPLEGDLHSTLNQLDLLAALGLSREVIDQARDGLLEGAGR